MTETARSAAGSILFALLLSPLALAQEPPAGKETSPPPTWPQVLAEIEEYGKRFPDDVVGLRDRYLDARLGFAVGSEAHGVATARIEALDEKVGEAYRAVRPSSGGAAPPDERKKRKLALVIARDLKKRSRFARLRAAEYLARLACDSAAPGLVRQLRREEQERVRKAIVAALVAVGGPKVGEMIELKLRDAKRPARMAGLDVLEALIAPSEEEEDKRASLAVGAFVFDRDPDVVERALTILAKAGGLGVWGLIKATSIADHQLKLRVIRALGDTGEGRAAAALATFLDIGAKERRAEYKEAAVESIEKIGLPAVPWLVRYLEDPNCRQWTKRVLYDITGQSFERADEVLEWWGRHERRKAAK